jgi:hypothetical protein
MLDAAPVSELEPELRCTAALMSLSTGIIDSLALMMALLGDAVAKGAMLCLNIQATSVRVIGREFEIVTKDRQSGAARHPGFGHSFRHRKFRPDIVAGHRQSGGQGAVGTRR